MGWVNRITEHRCWPPNSFLRICDPWLKGSIWVCDECKQHWMWSESADDPMREVWSKCEAPRRKWRNRPNGGAGEAKAR